MVIKKFSHLDFSQNATVEGKNQVFNELAEGLNFMGKQLHNAVETLRSQQKSLLESRQQFVQAAKLASLGEMSSGLAHEVNNPLFVALGNLETTVEKMKKDHTDIYIIYSRNFEYIELALGKIQKIVEHMRDFSRESPSDICEVDINKVVESSADFLGEQFKAKQIQVFTNLTLRPAIVMADFTKMEQVLINLLTNARDSFDGAKTDQAQKMVEISTYTAENSVHIEFKDNGCGMEESIKEKVFDAFFTTKPVGSGTGLGLSVSYGIIKEFNGEISVQSEVNMGTTFKIRIPAATP